MTTEEETSWCRLRDEHYGSPFRAWFMGGVIDFSLDGFKSLSSAPKCMTYDDYLAAQVRSIGGQRDMLRDCFFRRQSVFAEGVVSVAGDRMSLVSSLSLEADGRHGSASHVWIYMNSIRSRKDASVFKSLREGDTVSFSAEPYRYFRKDGTIDFGLKNPCRVRKTGHTQI